MRTWVWNYAGMVPLLMLVSVLVIGGVLLVYRFLPSARRPGKDTLVWGCAFLVWLLAAAMVTLTPGMENPASPGPRVDLVPFRTFLREGPGVGGIAVWERAANVALFTVGAALWSWTTRQGVVRTAVVFLGLGVGIEMLQLPLHRAVTADDVLWALLGGLVGGVLGRHRPKLAWGRTGEGHARPKAD